MRDFVENEVGSLRDHGAPGISWALLVLCFALAFSPAPQPAGDRAASGSAEVEVETGPEMPVVALTFDDGPRAATTGRLLDELALREVPATFFLLGHRLSGNEELVRRLNAGEIPHVRQAFLANAQSKVLLVEFDQEIAEKILDAAPKFGAAPHPVGSESKYEFAPMIYRVSGTFRAQDPTIEHRMIRINPMRSGPDTIIRILRSCMEQVEEN